MSDENRQAVDSLKSLVEGSVEVQAEVVSNSKDEAKVEYDWESSPETLKAPLKNQYPLVSQDMSLSTETLKLKDDEWESRFENWQAPIAPEVNAEYWVSEFTDEKVVFKIELPWETVETEVKLNNPNAIMLENFTNEEDIEFDSLHSFEGSGTVKWLNGWYPKLMFTDGFYGSAKDVWVKRGCYESRSYNNSHTVHYVEARLHLIVLGDETIIQKGGKYRNHREGKKFLETLRGHSIDPTAGMNYRHGYPVSESFKPNETIEVEYTSDGWKPIWCRSRSGMFERVLGKTTKVLSFGTFLLFILLVILFLIPLSTKYGLYAFSMFAGFLCMTVVTVVFTLVVRKLRR